jgi:hypothetical protein
MPTITETTMATRMIMSMTGISDVDIPGRGQKQDGWKF